MKCSGSAESQDGAAVACPCWPSRSWIPSDKSRKSMNRPPLAAGIAAGWALSPDLVEGCHTGKPKLETPILITDFLARRDNGYARSAFDCPFTPATMPLRAMSLSRVVSQYGIAGMREC